MKFFTKLSLLKCNLFLWFIFFSTSMVSFAQTNKAYWQQQVNYNLTVSLNDEQHELNGFANIQYINHSQQELENRSTKFYFSKDVERGKLYNLSFKVNDKAVPLIEDANHPDIAEIKLNKALKPGDTINITTPFTVKIPKNFSRLGRDGESYQLTQWYPKALFKPR